MPELKIGDTTYSVSPLPAMRAFALQPRIAPAVSEVLSGIGTVAGKLLNSGTSEEVSVEQLLNKDVAELLPQLGPLVARIAAAMPSGELEAVTRELLFSATMDGKLLFGQKGDGDPFDVKMRGRLTEIWQLLWFAVKVNYPDFFGLLAGKGAGGKAPRPSAESTT